MTSKSSRDNQVTVSQGSIAVEASGALREVPLTEVRRVEAFKIDQFTIDTIWVQVHTDDGVVEFSEDYFGFTEAMAYLVSTLPNANVNWRFSVLETPFAQGLTIVWRQE